MTSTAAMPNRVGPLVSRTIVTLITAGGFVALCWADATGFLATLPAWWLTPVAALLGWGAATEGVRMAAKRGVSIRGGFVPAATAALPLVSVTAAHGPAWAGSGPAAMIGWAAFALVAALAAMLVIEIARYRPGGASLGRVATGTCVIAMIGLPLAFMVGLRLIAANVRGVASLVPLVSMVAVVKGGDIAAYCIGSLVGRHKLAPLVSPGKSWEGAAASLAASLTVAWAVLEWSGWSAGQQPLGGWIVYGLAVGVAGMLGDLSESLVKRDLGAKDSGGSLGGMGGFLDLIDALLLAAPVAWVLWVLGG